MSHKILLVEDDFELAELTQEYLVENGFDVDVEHNGLTAIERIAAKTYDLLLLDIMLPGTDGLSICRQVREQFQGSIMMLTAKDEQIDEILGIELGADDYLSKKAEPRLMLTRIKALLRRAAKVPESSAQQVEIEDLVINNGARCVSLAGLDMELSNPEYDLLWLLVQHRGRILSREDIFKSLRGIHYDGQNRLIDILIYTLRNKLSHRATWIKTVRNKGYLFVDA